MPKSKTLNWKGSEIGNITIYLKVRDAKNTTLANIAVGRE